MDSKRSDWMKDMVMQHETSLIAYTKSLLWDISSAREVVQDTFLKLWLEVPPPTEGHVRPWLFTVCRNGARDRMRQRGLWNQKREELSLEVPAFDTQESLEWRDAGKLLTRLMDTLTEAQAEVIRLKFQEEMSYKEISELTGHSVNHVGVLIHQAVTRLREAMKKGGKA